MKLYWRFFSVALLCFACAGIARSESYAPASSIDNTVGLDWTAERPRRLDTAVETAYSEQTLLTGATYLNVNGGCGPAQCCDGQPACSCCDDCCIPLWAHRNGVFGELLFLQANAEVAYAVPIDGAIIPPPAAPIQVGAVAVADPNFSTGFRIGATYALDICSSLSFTYSHFDSDTQDAVTTNAPLVLRSLVLHPGTANAGSDFLDANANIGIQFDLVDLDYRAVWASDDLWVVNYLLGARYANLTQNFNAAYGGTGTVDTLATNTIFDGGGMRLGLDAQRFACNSGLMLYGRTSASFIAGQFISRYTQASDVDPIIVDTSWKAGRIVSILDLELGVGWQSACGRWRVSGGYMVNAWFNTVNTNSWIQGVQRNNFVGLSDTITFDGFTSRLEYRW